MRFGEKPYCLVLSGGGARGVYHIGAWRALRELKIPVNAFIGNSIGAIIAGFLAQGAEQTLEEIGRTINVDTIVNLPEGFKKDGLLDFDPSKLPRISELYRKLTETKGIDTSPMLELLRSRLDEGRIRRSGNDLGIVTVNVSDIRPREVFLEEMEEGRLIDYLMASSALPGFSAPEIDGKKYADGGLWDNIPYAMARKRGYTRIIVIDISGVGLNRRPDIAGGTTVYIRNSIDMGGVLDFNRGFLDAFTELGYLDTMRVFGRLKGYSFFIKPNDKLERRFNRFFAENSFSFGSGGPKFPDQMRYDRDLLLKYLECAATITGVERVQQYTYEALAEAIDDRLVIEDERLRAMTENVSKEGSASEEFRRGIELLIRESLRKKFFDECPYYVMRLLRSVLSGQAKTISEKALDVFWPSLDAGFAYIDFRKRFWDTY
ncbi:MAG: patatin-like phospholipase family protein [Treponemataceae bacterium]